MSTSAPLHLLRPLMLGVVLTLVVVLFLPYQLVDDMVWADPAVRVERNIEFARLDENHLKLDLAVPREGTGPFPALVFIPGGAWRIDGNAFHDEIAPAAKRGFVAVRMSYRLIGDQNGRARNPFPAQVDDVRTAIAWLRENADRYHVDPNRIGLVGMSAGGHLALLAGLNPNNEKSSVRAVVNFYGPTDLLSGYKQYREWRTLLRLFLDGTPREIPEQYKAASPLYSVSSHSPPVLTFHGRQDHLVPIEQAELLDAKMKQVGASHRLVVFEDDDHGLTSDSLKQANDLMYDFLEEHLGPLPGAKKRLNSTANLQKTSGTAN